MKSTNFLTWHVCGINLMFCTFSRTILGSPCVMWAIMTGTRRMLNVEWAAPSRDGASVRAEVSTGARPCATQRWRHVTLDSVRRQQQRPSNNTGRCAQLCCWRRVTFSHFAVATAPPARQSATTSESGPQQQAQLSGGSQQHSRQTQQQPDCAITTAMM